MMDNGNLIKCMALENCIMKMEIQPMKDTGKMINSMDKVESTTWNP